MIWNLNLAIFQSGIPRHQRSPRQTPIWATSRRMQNASYMPSRPIIAQRSGILCIHFTCMVELDIFYASEFFSALSSYRKCHMRSATSQGSRIPLAHGRGNPTATAMPTNGKEKTALPNCATLYSNTEVRHTQQLSFIAKNYIAVFEPQRQCKVQVSEAHRALLSELNIDNNAATSRLKLSKSSRMASRLFSCECE